MVFGIHPAHAAEARTFLGCEQESEKMTSVSVRHYELVYSQTRNVSSAFEMVAQMASRLMLP